MVISFVNTKSIHSKIYIGVARYLLGKFWLVSDVRVRSGSHSALVSCHDVTGPDMIDLNLQDAHVGWARDGPWKLKLVAKRSLPVVSRLGLTVAPAAAVLPCTEYVHTQYVLSTYYYVRSTYSVQGYVLGIPRLQRCSHVAVQQLGLLQSTNSVHTWYGTVLQWYVLRYHTKPLVLVCSGC